MLRDAVAAGIVRTVVLPPPGLHTEVETSITELFGLADAIVVDALKDEEPAITSALAGAAAGYLQTTLRASDRVGISSWSSTLVAMVDNMVHQKVCTAELVVQVLGGLGNVNAQIKATHLIERLAQVTGGRPVYFSAPGIVASAGARDAILAEPFARTVSEEWSRLSVLIAGIGSTEPSPMLLESGNAISQRDAEELARAGAVGDICLQFFDAAGGFVDHELTRRTVGIDVAALRAVPRRIGIAGGRRKFRAIRASLLGGWVHVLITDLETARRLIADQL
jgi:DNA-binding transcriptional regulator LsrR (DeoR family)